MRKYVVGEYLTYLISTSPTTVPTFLVPLWLPRFTPNAQQNYASKREHAHARRFATAATGAHLPKDATGDIAERKGFARRAMSEILSSPRTPDEKPWSNLLEPYLPPYLRRKVLRQGDSTDGSLRKPVPTRDLYIWLAEARRVKESKGDILTYLAVEEGREDAVVWLVEEITKEHIEAPKTRQIPSRPLLGTSQTQPSLSLEEATWSAEATQRMIDATAFSGSSLDPLTERVSYSSREQCLGEIWRSIGSMMLQAADREPSSAESQSIMACVHRILAYLHHVGVIPSSIYNYPSAKDPSVLQRPPTIHYWSLRIMTVISDALWNSTNTSSEKDDDNSLPSTEMSSMMPEVEPQIWLEFLLWCCVEGGWITEAAEIIHQMWTRKDEGRQYSVIDYNTLSEQHAPKLPWGARIKASIRRSRMRETAGGATFGSYSDRIDFLKPPERTVSSEVVTAIVDGLVNSASSHPNLFGNNHSIITKYITVCKIMLDRGRYGLGFNSWNSILLRIFESLSGDQNIPSTFMEQIISWSPTFLQEPFTTNSAYQSDSVALTYTVDPSTMGLGLLYRLLSGYALIGDLRGALRIFRRLQSTVDTNRQNSLKNFAFFVTQVFGQDGEDALIQDGGQHEAPGLNLQIPPHILAPFLDLITDTKEFKLGDWLLHSDDIDGCIIPPSLYSDTVLQPSLIRFASNAGDDKLLDSVTKQIEAPIPEHTLRALLHHQISCANWEAVHEILGLLRDSDEIEWDETDVIALASAALKVERQSSETSPTKSNSLSSTTLLTSILRGQYNTPLDPSRPRDLSEARMLNQLARIIASVPGHLEEILLPFCSREHNQLSASCIVQPKAFNMFLKSVVELYGVVQGKQLCDTWCFQSRATKSRSQDINNSGEHVVYPNIQTYYTILRPLSQAITDADKLQSDSRTGHSRVAKSDTTAHERLSEDADSSLSRIGFGDTEQSVVDWGIDRCFNLGVSWKEMKQDLPGLAAFGRRSKPRHTASDADTLKSAENEAGHFFDNRNSKDDARNDEATQVM